MFMFCSTIIIGQTVTDFDGNIYNTVKIGNQTWISQDIKSKHYSDGTSISDFIATTCNYSGALLYDWYTTMHLSSGTDLTPINVQGVCPVGWHVPNKSEWQGLSDFLGGDAIASSKMVLYPKNFTISDNSWNNSSGFSAVGNGNAPTAYGQKFTCGDDVFWSSTLRSKGLDNYYSNASFYTYTIANNDTKGVGDYRGGIKHSVRCIKDNNSNEISIIENSYFKIYPNPAFNILFLDGFNINNKYQVTVFSINGEILKNISILTNQIDVSDLNVGLYTIRIINNDNVYFNRFIIQR